MPEEADPFRRDRFDYNDAPAVQKAQTSTSESDFVVADNVPMYFVTAAVAGGAEMDICAIAAVVAVAVVQEMPSSGQ